MDGLVEAVVDGLEVVADGRVVAVVDGKEDGAVVVVDGVVVVVEVVGGKGQTGNQANN